MRFGPYDIRIEYLPTHVAGEVRRARPCRPKMRDDADP
jgi:hypothetical protein